MCTQQMPPLYAQKLYTLLDMFFFYWMPLKTALTYTDVYQPDTRLASIRGMEHLMYVL